MLDVLKGNAKISQGEEKLIAEKMEESLNIFPEFWYVEDVANRHPNIEKDVSREVLTKWLEKTFGIFTVTPYAVMDEWLTRLQMPENVKIHIEAKWLTIQKGVTSYSYDEWGRLKGKKTPMYTLTFVNGDSIYFEHKEQKEKIFIRSYKTPFESIEISMIEAIMQTILEKEKKWDLFTVVKTIEKILGASYQVSLIAEDEKVIEECKKDLYYKNGTEFFIQNQENWKVQKGLITIVCINDKKNSYIEIGNRRIELTTQIAQESIIEDILTKYKNANSYTLEQLVPMPAYDVWYVEEEAIKINGKKDIKSFFSIVKILPTELRAFLEKCGIYSQSIEMDWDHLYATGENEKKICIQSYGEQGMAIRYEDSCAEIEVKYTWENERFEITEISVRIGTEEYYEEKCREEIYRKKEEDVICYERSFQNEGYSLIVKETEINRDIRKKVLTLKNEGIESLRKLQNISKDIVEISCSHYKVKYSRDYKVTSIDTQNGRTYFYQYPGNAWSLEWNDSVILSDGSLLQEEQEIGRLSEKEIELLYTTVIVPIFLI